MIKTLSELRDQFWASLAESSPELAAMRRSRKTQNDYPVDIRMAWCGFVDDMNQDGQISNRLAERATL